MLNTESGHMHEFLILRSDILWTAADPWFDTCCVSRNQRNNVYLESDHDLSIRLQLLLGFDYF